MTCPHDWKAKRYRGHVDQRILRKLQGAIVRSVYWVAYLIGIALAAGVVVQAVGALQLAEASPGSGAANAAVAATGAGTVLVLVYVLCIGAARRSFRRRDKARL